MSSGKLTYAKSGVNIKKADKFVKHISKKTNKSGNFKNIGGFGAISNIPKNLNNPHIVTSTDGVGTKIEIANDIKKFNTIGIDLVAMCVNDLIVQGAKPYLFLDYISSNKINLKKFKSILKGIIKGCKIANCKLVGGETAEMPGTYESGKFDIAGFSVGLVEKHKILKGKIKKNDLILAVPSNGIHSNGYSLVRELIKRKKILKTFSDKKIKIGKKVKIVFVKDRPGHDFRYSLNSNKIKRKLKWRPKINLNKGISKTVNWYIDNQRYFSPISKKLFLKRLGK